MGYLNLAREEADEMAKKGERSLVLLCVVFGFVCLLLSGGWRLVGTAAGGEEPMPVREFAQVRAVLSQAQEPPAQTGVSVQREESAQRMHAAPVPQDQALNPRVTSDANGNVLLGQTYMRAVYQAFALDDGFV